MAANEQGSVSDQDGHATAPELTPAETQTTEAPITLSASAARQIAVIVADEPENKLLRVVVEGGGCSGFQYRFELTNQTHDDDLVIERDGATVVIDSVSVQYLEGSTIDYVDALIGASFQINNPNATASCGCGTSFSL